MQHTKESLCAFTDRVKQAFLDKRIHAPVHLNSPEQAEPLINIFKDIGPQDWVFSTWRSMWHALLKGIPEEWVFNEILAGRSMYLMNREHRFMAGSIIGGMLPIALGVAMGLQRNNSWAIDSVDGIHVWVFVGDMAGRSGQFHEFVEYAKGHNLPIRVVIEDNGLSTDSPTEDVWGHGEQLLPTRRYKYKRTTPHVGVGRHVSF